MFLVSEPEFTAEGKPQIEGYAGRRPAASGDAGLAVLVSELDRPESDRDSVLPDLAVWGGICVHLR
jgi:hypothetical protein